MLFFVKKVQKNLVMSKKCSTFAPAFEKKGRVKRDESVAQQVEHIPFKDGVLGSSPSWFTRREFRLSFIARYNFACKITTKNPYMQEKCIFICLFPEKIVTLQSQLRIPNILTI